MKMISCKADLAAAVFSAIMTVLATTGVNAGDGGEFPYSIQPDLGATEFAPGDNIVITSVRGDRQHIEIGGHYLLEGSYTLRSAERAELAWYSTSRGQSGSTPVTDDQHLQITAGAGNFRLKKTMTDDGWLHVSFYVHKHSHGGIYFGEKGFESTVLRQKGWSDFPRDSREVRPYPGDSASEFGAVETGSVVAPGDANRAIMAYLGDPVPAPANLSLKYWPTNLAAAFIAMGDKSGWRVQRLTVDKSEFPFLVYGIIEGQHELVAKDIREIGGYEYSGSVRGSTDKGSTYFSLNMIPPSQYPAGQAAACNRRLMVRLQMLADAVRQAD